MKKIHRRVLMAGTLAAATTLGIGATVSSTQAELDAPYRGTIRDARAAELARINSRFDVDRAKCSLVFGYQRDNCIVAAHAGKSKAMRKMKAGGLSA